MSEKIDFQPSENSLFDTGVESPRRTDSIITPAASAVVAGDGATCLMIRSSAISIRRVQDEYVTSSTGDSATLAYGIAERD